MRKIELLVIQIKINKNSKPLENSIVLIIPVYRYSFLV